MSLVVIEGSAAEWRIARLDDGGRLSDCAFIAREGAALGPMQGEVYLARVKRIDKKLEGAFLDLGRNEEAYLRLGDQKPPLEGAALIVEVAREAQDGKGPRVSRHIDLSALKEDFQSLEARARAAEAPALLFSPDAFQRALDRMAPGADRAIVDGDPDGAARRHLGPTLEIWRETAPAFEALGIEAEITALLAKDVAFGDGATLMIEPTAALIAIDVNSGRSPHARAEINRLAVQEIARQIRLRNLAGRIVIDFIDGRDQPGTRKLAAALGEALSEKGRECRVAGPTAFGLVEIERERRGRTLAWTTARAAAVALRKADRARPAPGRRLKISASQAVYDWLKARPSLLAGLGSITVEMELGLKLDQTRIDEI